jgi:hypothetical protein
MKTAQIIATTALALLAAAGAHADVYDYVPNVPATSVVSRSETQAQAVAAAHGTDIYRQSAMSGVVPTRTSAQDRVAVRAGAVAAAHAPYQNMQTSSFVNSRVPAGRGNGFSVF